MLNQILIIFGKLLSYGTQKLNLGNGSTWPGHIALLINKNFIKDVLNASKVKVIIIAGTNGKTTTSKMISTILTENNKKVLHNESGANLLNGIASSLLLHSSILSAINYDYAIFEVDENSLPLILDELIPDYLIVLNLFRDQLDRYGEVNTIAVKWQKAIQNINDKTTLILNADDPQVAFLGINNNTIKQENNIHYFSCSGLSIRGDNKAEEHAVDSVYCPECGTKLTFKKVRFSHLGDWNCKKCGLKRPTVHIKKLPHYPLPGLYNEYNTNAAVLFAGLEKIKEEGIFSALNNFKPAFGRQEELTIKGKHIRIFLSKNPTGFNESFRTIKELGAKNILFVLNDRIPDGKDVSWIWDTDLENLLDGNETIYVSGDRAYDMALRIKYSMSNDKCQMTNVKIFEHLKDAIQNVLENIKTNDTLYIIPTYTAMLETRKILTGRKIL